MLTKHWVNDYFSKLNPLAEKIAFDMTEVISAYDQIWITLDPTEQQNILNDTLIKPEISVMYHDKSSRTINNSKNNGNKKNGVNNYQHQKMYTFDGFNMSTFIPQCVGLKLLHDDNIGDYRDEHSFPFSYKTESQMNLVATEEKNPTTIIQEKLNFKKFSPIKQNVLSESNHTEVINLLKEEEKMNYNYSNCIETVNLGADDTLNLLSHSGSNNTLLSESTDSNDFDNEAKLQNSENCQLLPETVQMPKGFDFLSNW